MRGDFRQYYLSDFVMPFSYAVIHFSNPIIPFRSLLFIFLNLLCHYAFFYSVSNSIIRFRIMFCSFPLYSPLMQFRILLFPFKFCCSLFQFCYAIMHSFIQFPILLFAFELCSSKSGTLFIWPAVPWGPVTNWFPEFPRYRKTWRTWTSTPLRNRLRASINVILQ